MKQIKKLALLSLLILSFNVSCSSTETRSESSKQTPIASTPATCDELLDLCAVVVEKQKEAIAAQTEVIEKAAEVIENQDKQIENEADAKKIWRGIGIGEAILLLILLL